MLGTCSLRCHVGPTDAQKAIHFGRTECQNRVWGDGMECLISSGLCALRGERVEGRCKFDPFRPSPLCRVSLSPPLASVASGPCHGLIRLKEALGLEWKEGMVDYLLASGVCQPAKLNPVALRQSGLSLELRVLL